ncbi:MAG: hypothetical protein GY866_16240 [Proteobacteria bacterium]|nr:hypothetical protein [Pseudomonadota bacterium]
MPDRQYAPACHRVRVPRKKAPEPVGSGHLAPEVELVKFRAFKRVCHTCCNPDECVERDHGHVSELEPLPSCQRRCN